MMDECLYEIREDWEILEAMYKSDRWIESQITDWLHDDTEESIDFFTADNNQLAIA